ncbi:MAG: pilus assembly protein TadG-related protein [candidate division FCPU426 bacterium]
MKSPGNWKGILRRLRNDESGNVLYMTLILVLLLASFTLVTANVIYMGVMKARAQNAADQLALSAAALKARLLNKITYANLVIYVARIGGTVNETKSYPDPITALSAQIFMAVTTLVVGMDIVPRYRGWYENDHWIDRIATENGLKKENNKFGIYPYDVTFIDLRRFWDLPNLLTLNTDLGIKLRAVSVPFTIPVPIEAIEPNYDWYVQSRVEWKTKNAAIGGKTLGIELLDITTRARAELYDAGTGLPGIPAAITHNWRVRLTRVDEDIDREMRRRMGGSQNTGQIQPNTYTQPASLLLLNSTTIEQTREQLEEQMIAEMDLGSRSYYINQRLKQTDLSAAERVRYYNLKEKYIGLSFMERGAREWTRATAAAQAQAQSR